MIVPVGERVENYYSHSPRHSDSASYDEVCIICGARDYVNGNDELSDRPCQVGTLIVKITVEQRNYCKALTAKGYRRVSNRHGIVARVDQENWVEVLARSMHRAVADFYIIDEPDKIGYSWADHYRRAYSKDQITLDPTILARLIPGSSYDTTGYVP